MTTPESNWQITKQTAQLLIDAAKKRIQEQGEEATWRGLTFSHLMATMGTNDPIGISESAAAAIIIAALAQEKREEMTVVE